MTVNYKVIFRNNNNPDDGVTIVPGSAAPTAPGPQTIDVPATTDYVFEVDSVNSNPHDFTFTLLFNFAPVPSKANTITDVIQAGKTTTFTAHNAWYIPDWEYFLVAQAQAGAMRGSSLMGRKPIIRTAGAKIRILLILGLLLALCLAMLVFIAASH